MHRPSPVRAVKCVIQNYSPSEDILELQDTFRTMVNEALKRGIEANISSKFKLIKLVYPSFKNNGLHTHYILTACEKAASMLKNYRREKRKNPNTKIPYVRRKFVSVDNQSYSIDKGDGILRFAIKSRHFVEIPLNKHTIKVLSAELNLKLGSLTLTAASKVVISYSKEIAEIESCGLIGVDRNLENTTIASSDGTVQKFDTSRITAVKEKYSQVKSHFKRNDHRIRKTIYSKYGRKQAEIENQELHNVSKEVVEKAKTLNFGIVMEKLKGIRKLYRKGNWQRKKYRRRLNSWSFFKLQKMIEYKARWNGIKVIYVSPQKTSSTCAICGSQIVECAESRKVWCPKCETLVDRDENAARNILVKGALRFGAIGLPSEVVNRNGTPTTLIRGADGSQLVSLC